MAAKHSSITLGSNPLSKIKPDEWKNIPVCVIQAFKTIIEADEGYEAGIR